MELRFNPSFLQENLALHLQKLFASGNLNRTTIGLASEFVKLYSALSDLLRLSCLPSRSGLRMLCAAKQKPQKLHTLLVDCFQTVSLRFKSSSSACTAVLKVWLRSCFFLHGFKDWLPDEFVELRRLPSQMPQRL